ncbi:MAG: hypothetical protein J5795_02655 [Lachnospiraceae bacterium]|nr:hypothetical protein [Lachnospiraceae bacterium]
MKRYGQYFYELLYALPLSFGCLLLWQEEFGIKKMAAGYVLLGLLSCFACALLCFLKGKDRLMAAGVLLILLGSPALYGLRFGSPGYFVRHRYLWLIPLLCAACFLCGMLCRHFRSIRIITALAVITGLVLLLVLHYEVSKLCVMLLLTVLGVLLADETQILWKKHGETNHTTHLVFVAPFLALWLVISLMLPVSDKPYDWQIVKNLWQKVEDLTISFMQKRRPRTDDFDTLKPGFSKILKIRDGRLLSDDKVLLRLEPYSVDTPVLRVAGQYCDTFSELNWYSTVDEDLHEYEYDLMETKIVFEKTGRFTDYIHIADLNVVFREFSSYSFFSPGKLITDTDGLKNAGAVQQGHNISFKEKKGVGYKYNINCLQLNRRNDAFAEYLRTEPVITKEDWDLYISRESRSLRNLTYSGLLAYREKMKELYLPQTDISPAAREFLDAATEGAETDFDKMMQLEKALSEFEYSLTVGLLPENVTDASTFLDWFLEQKKGYCIHFATAMVLLARAEGLPARFVQGFCAPVQRNSPTHVISDMAHAWCEIYFEGIGWITFDATPGFYGDAFWTNGTGQPGLSGKGKDPTLTPTPVASPSPTPTPVSVAPGEGASDSGVWKLLLLVFAFLIFFTFAVLILDRRMTLRRFEQMNAADQVRTMFRRNRRLLNYLGLPATEEETLGEYAERLRKDLLPGAVDWISEYERFLYGEPEDARPIVNAMLSGNRVLTETFRLRYPKRYFLCKLANRLIR